MSKIHTPARSKNELLRAYGFVIKDRPNAGPNIWKRRDEDGNWQEFTEAEALKMICSIRGVKPHGGFD